MASFLDKNKTVIDDHNDKHYPCHDSGCDRALQKVHAEEGSNSVEKESFSMIVESFSFVVLSSN